MMQVKLKDGKVIEAAEGSTLMDLAAGISGRLKKEAVEFLI